MIKFLASFTGGRPMYLLDGCLFIDTVSGKEVRLYVDLFGRRWMATGGTWALFRVATSF